VVDNVAGSRAPDTTLLGIAGVAAALLFLAFLVGLLWWLVWGISRLPTLGSADLRLALRSLTTRRLRTAVTLLALTAGMFALSSITFFGLGAREIIRFQFSETLGGNILALPLLPPEVGDPVLDLILRNLDGVQHTSRLSFNTGRLIAVDGSEVRLEGRRSVGVPLVLLSRDSDNPALSSGPVLAGRDLTPEDRGRSVIVLSAQSLLEAAIESYTLDDLGVEVGSTVIVQVRGRPVAFEVVGIVGSPSGFAPNIAGAYLPPNAPGVMVDREVRAVQVAPDRVDSALRALAQSPLVFAVDVTFIDALMKRLLDQLSAIPTIVGLLSLLAAAVIMANTVALATLERRRQIGVLKAVGLKRRRVFSVMLLENTLIGLLGALLGIGLSLLGVNLLTALGTGLVLPIPSDALPIAAGLVIAAVLIAWTATFLSARAVVRERVAVVLRYE
jgi:predicted lysophospholipase L1 biosynthesis ABC-type transport system permease subunit